MARSTNSFRIEGGLFPSDFVERLTARSSTLDGLEPKDYGKQDQADRDEAIQFAFRQTLAAWQRFDQALKQAHKADTHTSLTRERFLLPLFEALGYGRLPAAKAQKLGDRSYPISHQWMHVPIHLLGIGLDLDRRSQGVRGAAQATPHGMVQEYLNASDDALWAIVSNGAVLRLLRDHKSLTRNAYVEFDLDRICADEDYPAFAVLWLLLHSSRAASETPESGWWEKWYGQARQDGVRALDGLRDGVQRAIESLGSGFLAHPANASLREALQQGSLSTQAYYRLLLRLVYRLLFLFVAEDREVLLQSREEFADARQRFLDHYGTGRLRQLAASIRGTQHGDLWQCLRLVMDKLGDQGCPALALPDLGASFWGREQLGPLAEAQLRNSDLLDAVRALAFTEENGVLHPVRYRDLGATEFGSVYESLLELRPQQVKAEVFSLQAAAGNERKTTGAYYTPDSLVECLLDSALDPLLQRCKQQKDPEAALLDLKVCDPACGSGHFLVAAAHRIAKALAQVRSGDDEPSPVARREAMRDVVARCLYGVDFSEMAVELCKVNLWLEAQAPDLPLAFLDAHIQQGNSLLGATPDLIAAGIPDEALEPLLGDDQAFCRQLKKENKARRTKGRTMFDLEGKAALGKELAAVTKGYLEVEAVADGRAQSVREKAEAYGRWAASEARRHAELVADAWCAAFVMEKTKGAPPPVTEEGFAKLRDGVGGLPEKTAAEVKRLGREYRFCHWHLKFPGVFGEGLQKRGFDLMIGNPPWEHVELKDKEWFAARHAEIAATAGAERKDLIANLKDTDVDLDREFKAEKRRHDATAKLIGDSGRFPLCARGRINTYSIFTELSRHLLGDTGRLGIIVPTGICTDDNNKGFFQDLVDSESLQSLFDFENAKALFPGVHRSFKFCALTVRGEGERGDGEFAFFLHDPAELKEQERRFRLGRADFVLLNPNTKTCPIFRSRRDAALTKKVYERVPVLLNETREDGNPWGLTFKQGLFNMTSASDLFRTRQQCEQAGFALRGNRFVKEKQVMLPLYEAKMVHHYDHRFGDYRDLPEGSKSTQLPDVPLERMQDPSYEPLPRYWVAAEEVESRLRKADRQGDVEWSWPHDWLLGWRDITNATNERTVIASVIPRVAVGNQFPLMLLSPESLFAVPVLVASLSSFACDFAARQKVGGTHLNFFIFEQLPVLSPAQAQAPCPWSPDQSVVDWVAPRVVELLAAAESLKSFAREFVGKGGILAFDPDRRFQIRCELDAAFFHLYGLCRDEVDYVMDTFPIVRKKDEKEFGDYRTKLVILDLYDQMAKGRESGAARQEAPRRGGQ
jgi:hypothetical protein